MSESQTTIAEAQRCSGIALHTGVRAHLTIKPGLPDTGIQVRRLDLDGQPMGRAAAGNVVDIRRATTIQVGSGVVHTVEHVLAALYACAIDNAILEMSGPEPPIMDGSSAPFIEILRLAGRVDQDRPRRVLRIERPLHIQRGETKLVLLPADEYRISCTVKFGVSLLDTQYLSLAITEETFTRELAAARTFCLYEEIEGLMVAGLIRGGSLDNAVVLKDGAIICKEALRFPDEFVRHKMLDIVGDLSLINRRIIGEVIAIRPGHEANVALAQRVCAEVNTA